MKSRSSYLGSRCAFVAAKMVNYAEKGSNGKFFLEGKKYFDFDHYDSERLQFIVDSIPEKDFRRVGFDKKLQKEMLDAVALKPNEVGKNLKSGKAEAKAKEAQPKANDASVKGEKTEKTNVRPRSNSRV